MHLSHFRDLGGGWAVSSKSNLHRMLPRLLEFETATIRGVMQAPLLAWVLSHVVRFGASIRIVARSHMGVGDINFLQWWGLFVVTKQILCHVPMNLGNCKEESRHGLSLKVTCGSRGTRVDPPVTTSPVVVIFCYSSHCVRAHHCSITLTSGSGLGWEKLRETASTEAGSGDAKRA